MGVIEVEQRFYTFLQDAEMTAFKYGLNEIGESTVTSLGFGLAMSISRRASKQSK